MIDIKRKFQYELEQRLAQDLNFIQVIIGPRQVGKTTGVSAVFKEFTGPKLYISADSPIPYESEWLASNWKRARELGPNSLLVVDEVQKVIGWAETCKSLFDETRAKKEFKVVLLGSASLSIQEGLASSLAGRFELIKVPHWTLQESMQAFSWDLDTYLKYGGYPAASELAADFLRWQSYIRDSIVEPVLGRDISGLVRINKPALFRQTFRLASSYPAQIVSYQKMLGTLQDKGNATTIKTYLELIEGAFLIHRLEKYSGSSLSRVSSTPKLIPLAPALSNAFVDDFSKLSDPTWLGHIFESAVGAYLLKLPGSLYYWAEGNYEVDFVRVVDGKVIAYEVKSGLSYRTKSLEMFKKRFPKAEVIIVDKQTYLNWH